MPLPSEEQERIRRSEILEDDPGAGDVTYYTGWAELGAGVTEAKWRLRQTIYIDSTGITTRLWADGDLKFDNVWNDRASLSYS